MRWIHFIGCTLIVCVNIIILHAQSNVTISGVIKSRAPVQPLPFVNVTLKTQSDSVFVIGTVTDEHGRFTLAGIEPGKYRFEASFVGFRTLRNDVAIGKLSPFLDLGTLLLDEDATALQEIVVEGRPDAVAETMDKKTFNVSESINQQGGSLLQAMQNLPGVTVQDGRVSLRGSDRIVILIDGKQTALTGFGSQSALDNIPASAIERIEVITQPTSKYDANGSAGIINIIYKKISNEGWNGKAGLAGGLGALWVKHENYPTLTPQYQNTPKINPSVSINYRKHKVNLYLQGDDLYTKTLNKNEFVDRYYDSGDTVRQQTKRNRTTNIVTLKGGVDYNMDSHNTFSVSGLFSSEKILDRGQEPFYNADLSERLRLWEFLEDELKTTVTEIATWQHRFDQPGRLLTVGVNYTFHREDEKYFFRNNMPTYVGLDSFKLISDEHVGDVNIDYVQPLRHGKFETGIKFRNRYIPTNMKFIPGQNSPLDTTAGGWANYDELIPAVYGNYIYEGEHLDVEAGLRVEYVRINYEVNPEHRTYKSDGYHYTQPFPNLRLSYKLDSHNTITAFYVRRVDRPNEVDIRIFPKYDDAEIIKVGNPGLRPMFTNTFEVGHKSNFNTGYVYTSLYHRRTEATITRIASTVPGSTLIYNVFHNAGKSQSTGTEVVFSKDFGKQATFNLNLNGYYNAIDAFTVVTKYPEEQVISSDAQHTYSGSVKFNTTLHFQKNLDVQASVVYQAPDVVPQGKTYSRFYIDAGARKKIQNGKGEVFLNATDLANTLRVKRSVKGDGFRYVSTDYYETQVVRVGYSYSF